jgi:hypothetical protein
MTILLSLDNKCILIAKVLIFHELAILIHCKYDIG